MQDALAQLGRASGIHATMVCLTFYSDNVSAALRAAFRHVKYLVPARVLLVLNYLNDFWNHVAAPLNHHPVANFHAEPVNFALIMQRCAGHCGAPDEYGLQRRHRSQLACASYLNQNVINPAHATARGILVSNRPAWRLSGKAQSILRARGIYLDDRAIDFIGQLVAHLFALGGKL